MGKDALPAGQQLTLLCAELVNEAFLRQSAFSPVDRTASPARQSAMLALIIRFIDLAEAALARGAAVEAIGAVPSLRRLQRMGEDIGENDAGKFGDLRASLEADLTNLAGATHAA